MFNLRPIPLGSMPDIEPVFVVGAGRSGTTPLQLALNMHPQLGVYGETQAFFVHRKFGAETGEFRLRRLLEYWRNVVAGCSPYKDLLDSEEMQSRLANSRSYAEVLNLVMGVMAKRERKSRWGEKTPSHIFRIAEIRSCFPNAKIIHIIRDPRAVVSSTIAAFNDGRFTDFNIYLATRYWLRCSAVHVRQQAQGIQGRYTLVRYEDLVTRPERTLQNICRFLALGYVPDMLNFGRTASKYVQKRSTGEMPAFHALTQEPLNAGRADGWKDVLSDRHVRLIEQIVGRQMTMFGYEAAYPQYRWPRARIAFLSGGWFALETQRIAYREGRTLLWGLQRMSDLIENAERSLSL